MSALDVAVQERTRAQVERDEITKQASAIELRLATLGDEGLMRNFLDDRIGGGTYQQKLGTAALVRRDFEALSRKIVEVTRREESGGAVKDDELVINRIVLYIDDLDRCDMSKVVPVLRAVHLLLAFKAFVVVVGVDSRWVARCLQQHHEQIFADVEGDDGRRVTPLDYLEKIFQIPIWLEPVPESARVTMVRELLRPGTQPGGEQHGEGGQGGEGTEEEGTEKTSEEAAHEAAKSAGTAGGAAGAGGDADRPGQPRPQEPKTRPPAVPLKPLDLNPRGLEITDGEYAFIEHLGPLLSNSPRALKRFVNTYRLINVALADKEAPEADDPPADAEIRMMLLAVLVGMPEFSYVLQDRLRLDCPPGATLVDVIEDVWTDNAPHADASIRTRAQAQWSTVKSWLEESGDPWLLLKAARVQPWLDPVGRYTFNLTRASAALSAPAAQPGP